jgi:hypothetical protein
MFDSEDGKHFYGVGSKRRIPETVSSMDHFLRNQPAFWMSIRHSNSHSTCHLTQVKIRTVHSYEFTVRIAASARQDYPLTDFNAGKCDGLLRRYIFYCEWSIMM